MVTEMDEMPPVKTTTTEAKGVMKPKEENSSARTVVSVSRSLLLASLSGLVSSCGAVIVKQMMNIHPAQLICCRYGMIISLCLPQVVWNKENILGPPGCRILIYSRAFVEPVFGLMSFIAYRNLPLGEAAVIIACSPVLVTIVGKIFLNENFGLLQILSLLFTTVGMILLTGVYQKFLDNPVVYTPDRIYGLAAALGAVLSMTLNATLSRKSKHVHYTVLLFQSGVAGVIECVVVVLVVDKFRLFYSGLQQCFIIIIGLVSYCGIMTFTVATQNLDAGSVSTLRTASQIVFSFAWQVIIYNDFPNTIKILGVLLVFVAIVFVGLAKQMKKHLPTKCVKLC